MSFDEGRRQQILKALAALGLPEPFNDSTLLDFVTQRQRLIDELQTQLPSGYAVSDAEDTLLKKAIDVGENASKQGLQVKQRIAEEMQHLRQARLRLRQRLTELKSVPKRIDFKA